MSVRLTVTLHTSHRTKSSHAHRPLGFQKGNRRAWAKSWILEFRNSRILEFRNHWFWNPHPGFHVANNRGIDGEKREFVRETKLGARLFQEEALEFPIGDALIGCARGSFSLERNL